MSKTDWRAEQTSDETWAVIGEDGWAIAKHLNEPTARLIAAAPRMRDTILSAFLHPSQDHGNQFREALRKTGDVA